MDYGYHASGILHPLPAYLFILGDEKGESTEEMGGIYKERPGGGRGNMKSRFRGKAAVILLVAIEALFLSGCDVELFEDKSARYQPKAVERGSLLDDKYYVKDGTKFYLVHRAGMSSEGQELDASKSAWTTLDDTLIPNYYRNEFLARSEPEVDTGTVLLERYRDCGYCLGIHGASYENGYIALQVSDNIVPKTSAYEELYNKYSDHIMIESINGQMVSEGMVNEAGVITGMEKDAYYDISFYAGTYYGSCKIKADTHFFQSYEIYSIGDPAMTKNGYLSLQLPEDLKSGYYRVDGKGFFRYLDFKKGDGDILAVDYNVPYYGSEGDQIAAYSQQYVFFLEAASAEASVHAVFDPKTVTNPAGMVKMLVTSPDGKQMTVDAAKEDGEVFCNIQEFCPGRWTVNLSPQSMKVLDVSVEANEPVAEAATDVFALQFEEDKTGVVITVDYEGEGIVNAQVVGPDRQSYTMIKETDLYWSDTHTLKYSFAYLPAGEYKVNVHHYPDTKVNSVDYHLREDLKKISIITVEE